MRIVHVVSYYNTLMKYQEYYLAKEQVTQGHEVYVVTSERNFPFHDYKKTSEPIFGQRLLKIGSTCEEGINIIRLPVILELRSRILMKKLNSTVKNLHPDIIIVHSIVSLISVNLLLKKIPARYIFDDHMLYNQIDKSNKGKFIFFVFRSFIKNRLLKKAEKIVAISEGCIPSMKEFYGIPADRIQMIPLGADINLFKFDKSNRDEIRKKLGIKSDSIVIIYTGKVVESKMPHLIPKALNLVDSIVDLHILFVGNVSNDYNKYFQEELSKSRHPYTIHPQVGSEELSKMFCASDIAVYPAQATISTIEASSCSLPIICTNEIPERYKNGNGIGIEAGNLEQLTSALKNLIQNNELRMQMGMKGREYVENELSWNIISKRFLELPNFEN